MKHPIRVLNFNIEWLCYSKICLFIGVVETNRREEGPRLYFFLERLELGSLMNQIFAWKQKMSIYSFPSFEN